MKKSYRFILICLIVFSAYGSQKKWEGKTYEEQGVIIIENKGPGLWEKNHLSRSNLRRIY